MDVNALLQTLSSINKDTFAGNNDARVQVRNAARALVPRLETTREMYCRVLWHGSMLFNALGIADDLDFFNILMSDDEDIPKTTSYIADKASVTTELVQCVFRHLAAEHVVEECGPDLWKSNAISRVYATPGGSATIRLIDHLVIPTLSLPRYLRQNSFKIPTDPAHTAWQLGTNDSATVFDWFANHPEAYDDFNVMLNQVASDTPRTWNLLPNQSDRIKDWLETENGALLVDVGGGHGQDIQGFLKTYPSLTKTQESKTILLDRPEVINTLPSTLPPKIHKQPIDFLSQTPPRGALFYHYSLILHDWPDTTSKKILENAVLAMIPEKSRMLIHEIVIPKQGADPFISAIDLLMMAQFGSKERGVDEWYNLIESISSLEIVEIHSKPGFHESLIEIKRVT